MAVGGKGARPADWPGARPHVWGVLLGVVVAGAARACVWGAVVVWGGRGLGAAGLRGCSSVSVARRGASVARGRPASWSNSLGAAAMH